VDMKTANHVILRSGPVVEAVLATIAVPGVFPSQAYQDRLLIDGGVLDPVPVSAARLLAPGLPVVAVVLSPPLSDWAGMSKPRMLNSLSFLSRYMERFRFSQALNVFMASIDIGGAALTELLLEITQPEVVIRPVVRGIGLLDNVDPLMVARLGEEAAEAALPELNAAVSRTAAALRRLRRLARPEVRMPFITEVL
ncbi:MAG: patatin-like phospholipase family protein, partial [Chloroflexota bacterium]